MSTSHSLPFSNSPQHLVNTKRHSGTSQLPLPLTLSAPSSPRAHGNSIFNRQGNTLSAVPSSPTAPRSPSALSMTSRGEPAPHSTPPALPAFLPSSPPNQLAQLSSTHAGGIQPSASFFRPSRPNQQQQYSRPASEASSHEVPTHAPDPDLFQLAPLSKHQSNSSDEPSGSVGGGAESTADDHRQFSYLKRIKQSREPLLPIGARPSPLAARPAVVRERSGSTPVPPSPSRASTSRRVRNSLERVFSLHRGLSFDSIRKSTSIQTPVVPEGRPTFEGKLTDEERGVFPPASPIPRYKTSTSPGPFSHSLSVTVSRHSPSHPTPSPSPDPSFMPTPPNHNPPLYAVPIKDITTGKLIRNYQRHPSRNKFFFGGRLLSGGDSPWAFMASFTLLLGISGVWFGTTCVWWWHNESPAVAIIGAYLCLITMTTMLVTATCDPGILPRNLDPDPPYPATSPSDGGVRAPMPRDLKVRSDVVRVKYCPTCKTYRPPRSSHCKMCDNCVDGCDHHCQWVNNCVGRRNYTSFFVLLLAATTTLVLVICTSALHLYFLTRRENLNFRHALSRGAGSAVAFCLAIAVIWPVAALLSYHMRLLLLNITTIEQIRNQAHKTLVPGPAPPNPFSHGNWRRNMIAILCRPTGHTWLDSAGIATEDKREINPGMVDTVWDGDRARGPS